MSRMVSHESNPASSKRSRYLDIPSHERVISRSEGLAMTRPFWRNGLGGGDVRPKPRFLWRHHERGFGVTLRTCECAWCYTSHRPTTERSCCFYSPAERGCQSLLSMRGISRSRRRSSQSCARGRKGINGTLGKEIESCLLKRAMRQAGEDPKFWKHSGECPNAITA